MNWTEVVLPILLAIIAATPGVVALLRGRSKEKADVATAITEAAGDLLGEYRTKIKEIEEKMRCQDRKIAQQSGELALQQIELDGQAVRIKDLEDERDEMMEGVSRLCTQIRNLGHEPVWEPE